MKNIKLSIEYDGGDYQGWQTQKSGRTIQDIIQECIFSITGERLRLTGASRTDAGVHALGQVAVFHTESKLPVDIIMRALNAKLPRDIRIFGAEETDGDFNPRYGALGKSYFYTIAIGGNQPVFFKRYLWEIRAALNLDGMKEAAASIVGRHDFSAFRGSGCGAKTTVRNVYSLDISGDNNIRFMTAAFKGDFIKIRIEGDAFLRHMVRNIVGTLVEIGKGKLSPGAMARILESRDRRLAGPTAPANGLFLEKITY